MLQESFAEDTRKVFVKIVANEIYKTLQLVTNTYFSCIAIIMNSAVFLTIAVKACLITAFYTTVITILDALLKIICLTMQYLTHRENTNFRIGLYHVVAMDVVVIVFNLLCIFFSIILISTHPTLLHEHLSNINEYFAYILFAFLLWRVTNLKMTYNVASNLNNNNLDISTGLAYSYYYGYLKIILPSTGTASKGMLEKLENAEDQHNITIPLKKLVILIPASGYIPPDLKQVSCQWMESAITLEEEKRDRAGIKQRSYKNLVYKIYPGGPNSGLNSVYIAVEGATPVLSLYQIQIHSHSHTKIFVNYMGKFVEKFYHVLKELVENDPECVDVCELLYYNDKNSDGTKVNVAQLLLQKISKKKLY